MSIETQVGNLPTIINNKNQIKMENEERFLPPEKLKAIIALLLTKQFGNYNQVVDNLRNAYVGKDNVRETQDLMRNLSAFMNFVEDLRKKKKEPSLEEGRSIDKVFKEFISPFEEIKLMVQGKLNIVAREIEQDERKKREEEQRTQQRIDTINNFILDYSVKIASATNNEQLLGYERLINLEKANKSKYADQLSLLIERCNDLNAKIKDQKELIRAKEKLEKEKLEAEKKGDDEKLDELAKKEQEIDEKIEENTILVQEQASNSLIISTNNDEEVEGVKARRTTWKAELINVKEAMKKSPEMLDVSLNATKARDAINTLKAAGSLKGKTELIVNGIRYYEEKTF